MWVLGGWDGGNVLSDVWYSTDGTSWTRETSMSYPYYGHGAVSYNGQLIILPSGDTAPSPIRPRRYFSSAVFDGRVWFMGGSYVYIKYWTSYNDVWHSFDGTNWQLSTPHALWESRSQHATVVFDHKLWVLGGNGVGPTTYNDVWYTAAPFDPTGTTAWPTYP
jgi:hypothetical protein